MTVLYASDKVRPVTGARVKVGPLAGHYSRLLAALTCESGGRCGRRLGIAKINTFGDSSKPAMYLSNRGWVTDNGYPLLEAAVPADFSGSTGILPAQVMVT